MSDNYYRIERAISFIKENRFEQPQLSEIAKEVGVSPHHFQRIFTQWAGVSPKKFIQYLTIEHAREALRTRGARVLNVAYDVGLSGSGRLHDLFVGIERMTPGEYKEGGGGVEIAYQYAESLFGSMIVAATEKGICYLHFSDSEKAGFSALRERYPKARFRRGFNEVMKQAVALLKGRREGITNIRFHLEGTPFQMQVWEGLLAIPEGGVMSYGQLGEALGLENSARAIGSAVGANPVAYLIPCHRVIRGDGQISGYRWGETRKRAILGWESAQKDRSRNV